MKATTTKKTKGCLVQLRISGKDQDLNLYQLWEALDKALANHPTIQIEQAEFRVEKDAQTSI